MSIQICVLSVRLCQKSFQGKTEMAFPIDSYSLQFNLHPDVRAKVVFTTLLIT